MRTRARACSLATALVLTGPLLAARPAGAQLLEEPRSRQGYYLSLSVLGGTSYLREKGESLGAFTGASSTLRLGQLLTRRLGLGLQIDGLPIPSITKKGTQQASFFGLGVEAQVELIGNLAVHGGVGLGVLQLKDSSVKNEELRGAFGAQYTLAASYALFPFRGRKSGGFSLTPIFQARFLPGDNATAVTTMLGLDIGWWTGLPRNQLELPPEDAYRR